MKIIQFALFVCALAIAVSATADDVTRMINSDSEATFLVRGTLVCEGKCPRAPIVATLVDTGLNDGAKLNPKGFASKVIFSDKPFEVQATYFWGNSEAWGEKREPGSFTMKLQLASVPNMFIVSSLAA